VEADATPSGGMGGGLDRIEAAVTATDSDLRRLGFWRLVALLKRDDELIDRYADQVGRIDAAAFEKHVRIRVPVWIGLLLLVIGMVFGLFAFAFATWKGTPNFSFERSPTLAGIALVVTAGAWMSASHSLTHWIVGRAVGIRFTSFFQPPALVPPGFKTDYASYLRVSPIARAWMHASGAIATKLAPFVVLALAAAYDVQAPGWAIAILWIIGIGQLVTDALISTKKSDWKKVRRELGVARARRKAPA